MSFPSSSFQPIVRVTLILAAAGILAACGPVEGTISTAVGSTGSTSNYTDLTVEEFNARLKADDAFVVNVYIPYEGEIPGTDANIPYDQIDSQLSSLPQDLSQPVIVYCRSGNMSEIAARSLVNAGYQQVYNLTGGYRAWIAQGYDFQEQ
jgi:rhodanese-related sulfurtransferase